MKNGVQTCAPLKLSPCRHHNNQYPPPLQPSVSTASDLPAPTRFSRTMNIASSVRTTVSSAVSALMPDDSPYTWKQLVNREKDRRKILTRVEQNRWRILSHYNGTVLNILLTDSLFWITVLIYVGMRLWARLGNIPDYVADLGGGDIAIIGGFLTFFLVFYCNQSYSRYVGLYNKSMACKGRIFDVATLVVASLPDQEVATRIVRYMNASHIAGYTGLSKTYPASSFFDHFNKSCGLLTDEELNRLEDIDLDKGGSCYREVIAWAMIDVQNESRKGTIDAELAHQLREQLLLLRAAFGQLFNAEDLPIPFFYIHFICLLSAIYLPLFAISMGYRAGTGSDVYWTADVVSGLIVVLQAIFVIGLRILGQIMSDPYGYDLEDLSVIFFCDFTWRMSNRVLNCWKPPACSKQVEENLIKNRTDKLGEPFDQYSCKMNETEMNETDSDGDDSFINQLPGGMSFRKHNDSNV